MLGHDPSPNHTIAILTDSQNTCKTLYSMVTLSKLRKIFSFVNATRWVWRFETAGFCPNFPSHKSLCLRSLGIKTALHSGNSVLLMAATVNRNNWHNMCYKSHLRISDERDRRFHSVHQALWNYLDLISPLQNSHGFRYCLRRYFWETFGDQGPGNVVRVLLFFGVRHTSCLQTSTHSRMDA